MLTVLLLVGAEKLINIAISSDEITQAGLAPLAGKVLRLNMVMPKIQIDILFNHEHLRFEPVTTDSVLEPRGYSGLDCTISVDNPVQLLNVMRGAAGTLPIAGDDNVLIQLKQLVAGFDPDVAGQLEPFIGKPMASQLQLVISQLKSSLVGAPHP